MFQIELIALAPAYTNQRIRKRQIAVGRAMTAEELWKEFCGKKNIDINTPYEAWAFCGGGPLADELADLVLDRRKFGTASAYDDYVYGNELDQIPHIGDYSVILKDSGEAVCVIRDYDVYTRPFSEVPPFHGYAEGEGNCSLQAWREIHIKAFAPSLEEIGYPLNDDSKIVCEKFTVEYVPGENDDADELFFVEPTMEYASELEAYRQEMLDAKSSFDGCFSMKRLADTKEFVESCIHWSNPAREPDKHEAWGNVIMCFRKSDRKMIGCMQMHNILTERMQKYTGHVGYSVRPSERRKGYATKMLAKAKDFFKTFGFNEILVTCLTDNEGSRKTILKNGGVYQGNVYLPEDNVTLEQYKIDLTYL